MFKRLILIVGAGLLLAPLAVAAAAPPAAIQRLRPGDGADLVSGGRPAGMAKAASVDTVLVIGPWGSGALYNGQFETPDGLPAWNGWTSVDLTAPEVNHWNASNYLPVAGAWSAWCGDLAFPSCGPGDPDGGYGNDWNEALEWRGTVTDPAQPCVVDIAALVSHDSEPGYDFCRISIVLADGLTDLWTADGNTDPVPLNLQTTVLPAEYTGAGSNEVVIRFRFSSDGGWSDEDCQFPSAGAFRLDDLQIDLSNGTGFATDFEDGSLAPLTPVYGTGVGDFAKVWTGLQDLYGNADGNNSPKVAFIDDGIVVPGTGGTECITWCYGPGGYIVNNTGGLLTAVDHLHNVIRSPLLDWPELGYDAAALDMDVWEHEDLGTGSAGMFFTWDVRSTADPDSNAILAAEWFSMNYLYTGGPDWYRLHNSIGNLLEPDARWVQVQMGIYELGWAWGWTGVDGTPAPYIDNVRMTSYPYYGPALQARLTELAHDNFPAGGVLDLVNLGANSVRFDMGQPQDIFADTPQAPGDSIVVYAKPQRAGAFLVAPPRMHWLLRPNALFDPWRTSGLGTAGHLDGMPVMVSGVPLADKFCFDLPDSGFLFPGDVLHCWFEATDVVDGIVQTVTLPADTTGFSNFNDPFTFPEYCRVRALPSLRSAAAGNGALVQPDLLFWDDSGGTINTVEWHHAFRNLGFTAGVNFDIYSTSNPSNPRSQGLGGRASLAQIAGYADLIYTSGVQTGNTLSDGVTGPDRGDDIGLLTAWLELGWRDLLLMGDDLAGDLARSGGAKAAFLADWMGVSLTEDNVIDAIGGQVSPLVLREPSASFVLPDVSAWVAMSSDQSVSAGNFGGSLVTGLRRFDGVQAVAPAQRLAQFTTTSGLADQYAYSAATWRAHDGINARVVSFPYDLQAIWTPTGDNPGAPLAIRTQVLAGILDAFGQVGGPPSDVPAPAMLGARHWPNPFNPSVTISYALPHAGQLSIKVFDIRGRLVRTLADGPAAAGPGSLTWDGHDGRGEAVAAGVYFYEVRAGDKSVIGKMALIK